VKELQRTISQQVVVEKPTAVKGNATAFLDDMKTEKTILRKRLARMERARMKTYGMKKLLRRSYLTRP